MEAGGAHYKKTGVCLKWKQQNFIKKKYAVDIR